MTWQKSGTTSPDYLVSKNGAVEYDENFILKSFMSGKKRNEIAAELGHKSYKSLDMFMRRKGYRWSTQRQTYEKNITPMEVVESMPSSSKVHKVMQMIGQGSDPREVSKKLAFEDHKVMAEYMRDKGYVWSTDTSNYVRQVGKIEAAQDGDDNKANNYVNNIKKGDAGMEQMDILQKLMPMLEMMNLNKDKLAEILSGQSPGVIPRYLVPGICATRSIYMSHAVGELVKNFSLEKNITQKEVFEIALIDFLKKYGYEAEIKALLNQS